MSTASEPLAELSSLAQQAGQLDLGSHVTKLGKQPLLSLSPRLRYLYSVYDRVATSLLSI
jgi:hypothetical protein